VSEPFIHYTRMTNSHELDNPAQRLLVSAARRLQHLAFVALVGVAAYLLAVVSIDLADRGGWYSLLGWTAFGAVVVAGTLLVRRFCCLRRVQRRA
jgi:hypothetical protein